jgi:cell division topological specificity factor
MRRLLELLFPPKDASASIARERLRIVLAHERASRDGPDFLPVLEKELLAVVSRYIEIRPDMIRVNLGKSGETSLLEINVEIDGGRAKPASESASRTGEAVSGSASAASVEKSPGAIVAAFEPAKPASPVNSG